VVAALVLAGRWLHPLVLHLRHRLRVAAVEYEAAGVVSIEISGRRLDRFPAEPGRYFRWRFVAPGLRLTALPYSLSRAPDGRRLRITATVGGRHSSRLPDLSVGTLVLAEGPTGGLRVPRDWPGPVLLIGGGVGVTPLRALLESCSGEPVVLVHRTRNEGAALFRTELAAIAEQRGARVHQVTGSRELIEFSGEQIAELGGPLDRAWICVCGSKSFVRYVTGELIRCGARARQVQTESFEME
jgi:ferredoxin-NADP reductase